MHPSSLPSSDFCGALWQPGTGCRFRVWAPHKERMVLHVVHPQEATHEMTKDEEGYFHLQVPDLGPGARYFLAPNGEKDLPDPASFYQPETVHGPSEVVDHRFDWEDGEWKGIPFQDMILYELHVGTFTPEGTFEAIIPRLHALKDIGINALELMPVNQFPGQRNWGYDGVLAYAVQNSYGGPWGLKKLVNACHKLGIAVFLDVVYNHMGPEGNYISQFAPYFTNHYCTPWGDALNFDGEWSDGVRDYFAYNAQYWFEVFHMDGLRLDAIHMVFDQGSLHFWEYLNHQVANWQQRLGRSLYMTAESALNSPKVTHPPFQGGYGFTAQWLDDFHHALYVLLDKEGKNRYLDFGRMDQLAKAYKDGFVHSGEYVSFRKKKYGASSAGVPGDKFIAFNLNHDQIGNRVKGERLCVLVDRERLKLAAAALLLAPYVPMLFMGEEYADPAPFYYFVSHSDTHLVEAVRKGRKEAFAAFHGEGDFPDPQDEQVFKDSVLEWSLRESSHHRIMLLWHKQLIGFRQQFSTLRNPEKSDLQAYGLGEKGLLLLRSTLDGKEKMLCLFNFTEEPLDTLVPQPPNEWTKLLDSKDAAWDEQGLSTATLPNKLQANAQASLPPLSVTVYLGT